MFHVIIIAVQIYLRLPQYHMEEMLLQTCERYAPAGRSVLHELH